MTSGMDQNKCEYCKIAEPDLECEFNGNIWFFPQPVGFLLLAICSLYVIFDIGLQYVRYREQRLNR